MDDRVNLEWWTLSGRDRYIPATRRLLSVANVTPGQSWSFQVPGGCCWRVLFGQIDATTSAVVAQRTFGIKYGPPPVAAGGTGEAMWRSYRNVTNGALQGVNFSVAAGATPGPDASTLSTQNITVPDQWLEAQWVVGGQEVNLDAGDQYTLVRLLVDELQIPLWLDIEAMRQHERVRR